MIKNIIQKINESKIIIKINSINYIVSLKESEEENDIFFYVNNYELKPFDMVNFKPKEDSPNFSPNNPLKNFLNQKISFISKKEINIMLIEKYDDFIKNDYSAKNKNKNEHKNKIVVGNKDCLNYCMLI